MTNTVKVEMTDKMAIYVNGGRITNRATKWGAHNIVFGTECAKSEVVKTCLTAGYGEHVSKIDTEPYLSQARAARKEQDNDQ